MDSILCVCLGNICRSPLAEALLRAALEAESVSAPTVDSAGTSAFHVGEPPDARMQETARARGVDLAGQRSRQFAPIDFERFDLILVTDEDNQAEVPRQARTLEQRGRVRLMRDYNSHAESFGSGDDGSLNVPDPYYGGAHGFETVFDILADAAQGVVASIRDTGG